MVTLTVPVCQPGWEEMEILRDIWGNLRVNLKRNNSECQKVSLGGSSKINVTLIQMYILHNNCIYCCGLHNRLRPFVKHTKFLRFGQFDKPKWYPYHLSIFHDWPLWYCLLTCNFPVDKKSSKYTKNHIFLRSIEKQQKLKIKPAYIFELTLVVICFSVWTTDRIGLKRAEWTTALPRVGNSDFHSAVVQFTVCLFLLLWGTEFWTVFLKRGSAALL